MNWADSDAPLIGDVARALIELDEIKNVQLFRLPYPAAAQRALNRLALRALRDGATPPASVPDLVTLCQERPVVDWPLTAPPGVFNQASWLLDEEYGFLTDLCHEVALTVGVPNPWATVLRTLDDAAELCRERRDTTAYTAFRRLLIERPVLDNEAVNAINFDPRLGSLESVVKQTYQQVDERWVHGGVLHACGDCDHLAFPLDKYTWWCESARCDDELIQDGKDWTDEDGPMFHLDRLHRQFVSRPGRVVCNLADRLVACGAKAEPWPNFGAYDLRIVFPDREAWAVQVVDWSNPALAGAVAFPIPDSPAADKAFRVVPDDRLAPDPDYYFSTFDELCSAADDASLISDTRIVDLAQARLGGHRSPAEGSARA
ncbi:hypothetical protein [Amycolatopsis anabasis]|uniref:pPIWI_RE_Y domain-containing protein n=1 Tax=Amycolatopsis anabasis TaxID=1840409 RepID=UPI00131B490C|nr:hypothetical protein [Amycolatopsis anabasis]